MSRHIARRGQNLINRQSLPSTQVNSAYGNAEKLSPLRNRFFVTVESNRQPWFTLSSVVGLLFHRRPPAIARFVISIVVNAIKLHVLFGTLADVFKKRLKRLSPSVTDGYSATSIPIKTSCVRVFAPLNHRPPCVVFRRASFSVGSASFASHVRTEATATPAARSLNLASKSVRCMKTGFSAIAEALPNNQVLCCSSSKSNYEKAFKPLSGKIQNPVVESRRVRRLAMIYCSHEMFLDLKGCLWLGSNSVTALLRPVSLYHNLLMKGGTCGKS